MVKISDLNKREREIKQSLSALEKQFKNNKVPKLDYNKIKSEKNKELKKIELERKSIITKLPPIPPPPKPLKTIPIKPTDDLKQMRVDLKKQEKDLLFTQSEMSKLFNEVVKNRERVKGMENLIKELGSIKAQIAKMDMKSIDEKVSSQLERVNTVMRDNTTKNREELDRLSGDIRNLKGEIENLKKFREIFNTMDISGLRRDIESVKAKVKWLEQQINNIDIEPLYELIKEIEGRVSSGRATSPVIIE